LPAVQPSGQFFFFYSYLKTHFIVLSLPHGIHIFSFFSSLPWDPEMLNKGHDVKIGKFLDIWLNTLAEKLPENVKL
jgi:hypothetical protein